MECINVRQLISPFAACQQPYVDASSVACAKTAGLCRTRGGLLTSSLMLRRPFDRLPFVGHSQNCQLCMHCDESVAVLLLL